MNPQPDSTPNQPPVDTPRPTWKPESTPTPVEAPALVTEPTPQPDTQLTTPNQDSGQAPQPTIEPKKSHKKLLVIVVVAAIALVAIGSYVAYAFLYQPPKASNVIPIKVVDSTKTNNPELDAVTDALINSASSETTIVNTDDSSNAADASKDTTKIEESIDENSF